MEAQLNTESINKKIRLQYAFVQKNVIFLSKNAKKKIVNYRHIGFF